MSLFILCKCSHSARKRTEYTCKMCRFWNGAEKCNWSNGITNVTRKMCAQHSAESKKLGAASEAKSEKKMHGLSGMKYQQTCHVKAVLLFHFTALVAKIFIHSHIVVVDHRLRNRNKAPSLFTWLGSSFYWTMTTTKCNCLFYFFLSPLNISYIYGLHTKFSCRFEVPFDVDMNCNAKTTRITFVHNGSCVN